MSATPASRADSPRPRAARAARLQPPLLLGPAWGLPLVVLALTAWHLGDVASAALVAAEVAVGTLAAYIAWREPPPPGRRAPAVAAPLLALLAPVCGAATLALAAAAAHAVDAGRRPPRSVGWFGVAAGLGGAVLLSSPLPQARALAALLLVALLGLWWLRRPRLGAPGESTRAACPRCGVVRTSGPGRAPCPGCGLTLRLEWGAAAASPGGSGGGARALPPGEGRGEVWLACPRCRLRLFAPPGPSACPQCRLALELGWNVQGAALAEGGSAQTDSRSSRNLRS